VYTINLEQEILLENAGYYEGMATIGLKTRAVS
jgi:hypothetical protein